MDATVEEQSAIMRTFLEGLVDAFDLDATFVEDRVDEDTIELKVEGDNLGLLIGPKGQTLQSIQELSRTVVQRQATGTHHGRVRIDIGGIGSAAGRLWPDSPHKWQPMWPRPVWPKPSNRCIPPTARSSTTR